MKFHKDTFCCRQDVLFMPAEESVKKLGGGRDFLTVARTNHLSV